MIGLFRGAYRPCFLVEATVCLLFLAVSRFSFHLLHTKLVQPLMNGRTALLTSGFLLPPKEGRSWLHCLVFLLSLLLLQKGDFLVLPPLVVILVFQEPIQAAPALSKDASGGGHLESLVKLDISALFIVGEVSSSTSLVRILRGSNVRLKSALLHLVLTLLKPQPVVLELLLSSRSPLLCVELCCFLGCDLSSARAAASRAATHFVDHLFACLDLLRMCIGIAHA